jgi:hypothetical protein
MTTKERGDKALAQAISYYLSNGYEVNLPVGDKRSYDVVIEKDGHLERVQVKYAGYYPAKKRCFVGLRVTGGNQSYHYAKKYSDDEFEILFVYTEKGKRYHIPWSGVKARSELSIDNQKYDRFLV